MNHLDLWHGIENFARSRNMSCSALAKMSGLDATTFNKSKRWTDKGKPHWPSTQSIAKILTATNSTFEEFATFIPKRPKNAG